MPKKGLGFCPTSRKLRKYSREYPKKVLKMLAVMESQQSPADPATTHSQEFLTTGRTGRRNALPDILNEHTIAITTSDLPARLQSLTTNEDAFSAGKSSDGASTSKQDDNMQEGSSGS